MDNHNLKQLVADLSADSTFRRTHLGIAAAYSYGGPSLEKVATAWIGSFSRYQSRVSGGLDFRLSPLRTWWVFVRAGQRV
jgi:hypothetical protein